MNTCTAIDTKSAEHNENRKMERSTGSGGEVLQRDRQTLLDQDRQMVQVKKNASKPANIAYLVSRWFNLALDVITEAMNSASAASTATTAESIPPETPSTTLPKPHFRT